MSSRTYLCAACGKIRRSVAVHGHGSRINRPWPHCCSKPMGVLTDIQAEGAAKLRPAERVKWLALGKRMLRTRERGPHKWRPVLTPRNVARSVDQEDRYRRSMRGAV
jgi:hypothetical protein